MVSLFVRNASYFHELFDKIKEEDHDKCIKAEDTRMVASNIERTNPFKKEGNSPHESHPSTRVTIYEVDDDLGYKDELDQQAAKVRTEKDREMQSQFPNSRATQKPTRRD